MKINGLSSINNKTINNFKMNYKIIKNNLNHPIIILKVIQNMLKSLLR